MMDVGVAQVRTSLRKARGQHDDMMAVEGHTAS
jgi:hypothetical protein